MKYERKKAEETHVLMEGDRDLREAIFTTIAKNTKSRPQIPNS